MDRIARPSAAGATAGVLLAVVAIVVAVPDTGSGTERADELVGYSCRGLDGPDLMRGLSNRFDPAGPGEKLENRGLAIRYREEHPHAWAGSYIHRGPRGKSLYVIFANDNARRHAKRFLALAPAPEQLRLLRALRTERRLVRLQRRIGEAVWSDPPAFDPGSAVSGTSVDVFNNGVEVDLEDYSRDAARRLRDRFGPAVCVPPRDITNVDE